MLTLDDKLALAHMYQEWAQKIGLDRDPLSVIFWADEEAGIIKEDKAKALIKEREESHV